MRGKWCRCVTTVCCAVQMPNRDMPMTSFEDTRVDICLYFIAPHALLPTDIHTIKRLGKTVPVVPIISKVPAHAPNTVHCMMYIVKLMLSRVAKAWAGQQAACLVCRCCQQSVNWTTKVRLFSVGMR